MREGVPILRSVTLLLLAAAMGASSAHAQAGAQEGYTNTYARPGQETHTVYIWGAVGQPGVWEIAPNTGLVELFSVVRPRGYATETPDTRQEVKIRIHRTENGQTRVAHEMQLDALLEMNPDQRPTLQPEDVVEVRTVQERKLSFQTVSSVVGTLSSVTLLVIRIFDL